MMERYKQCYKQSSLHMLFLISFLGKEKDKIEIKQNYLQVNKLLIIQGLKVLHFYLF